MFPKFSKTKQVNGIMIVKLPCEIEIVLKKLYCANTENL